MKRLIVSQTSRGRVAAASLAGVRTVCRSGIGLLAMALALGANAQSAFGNLNFPAITDTPDVDLIDANDDGIDGMKYGPIFVDQLGSDENVGTLDAPMRTLNAAMCAAQLLGNRPVYVRVGTYDEMMFLPSGVSIYGGFAGTGTAWIRATDQFAVVQSPLNLGAIMESLALSSMHNMDIRTATITEPGTSHIAFWIQSQQGRDRIVNCRFKASAGRSGMNGTKGADGQPSSNGGNGEDGGFLKKTTGGAGGLVTVPGGKGGWSDPDDGWHTGDSGFGILGGAQGGYRGDIYDVGPGQAGGPGESGLSGYPRDRTPQVVVPGWAKSGEPGQLGAGGGGGGAGSNNGAFYMGGSGGGGGGGGDFGRGGSGGQHGGHSIAIFWKPGIANAVISLAGCYAETGKGGNGGKGGDGGLGAPGGKGGVGGSDGSNGQTYAGGDGGDGGRGGFGAGGNGGNAGYSVGMAFPDGATLELPGQFTASFTTGATAGVGGSSVSRSGYDGYAGKTGKTETAPDGDVFAAAPTVPFILATHARGSMKIDSPTTVIPHMLLEPGGDPGTYGLSITSTVPAQDGVASVSNGALQYKPDAGFCGVDRFSYRVNPDVAGRPNVDGVAVVVVYQRLAGKIKFGDWTAALPTSLDVEYLTTFGAPLGTVRVDLDVDGNFSTYGPIRSVNYVMRIKYGHWLSAERTLNNNDGNKPNLVISLVNGDCDGDDQVSLFDYLILSDAFDRSVGQTRYDSRADLDGDETVSLFDYLILSDNFDKSGPRG